MLYKDKDLFTSSNCLNSLFIQDIYLVDESIVSIKALHFLDKKLSQSIVLQMFYSCQLFLFRRAARGVKVRLDKKKKDTGPSKVSTYSRLTNTKQVITFVLHAFVFQYWKDEPWIIINQRCHCIVGRPLAFLHYKKKNITAVLCLVSFLYKDLLMASQ